MNNEYLVDMVSAYLKGEVIELPVDFNTAIKDAKEQNLLPFLYAVYQKKEFKQYYITSVLVQEKFLALQNQITEIFNKGKIKHLYLKGSVLCHIYPDVALRTRGDIDVLIEERDLLRVRKLFNDMGYEEQHACSHHIGFIKDGFEFEVHFKMMTELKDNVNKYYENPFRLAHQKSEYLYELDENEHFLFVFFHFVKHLYGGAGIRFLLDFYYMFKQWNLNLDYIHQRISEFGYNKAYNNMLNGVYYLSGNIFDSTMEEIDIKFFIDYLLDSGIHGFAEGHERDNKYQPIKENKFAYYMRTIFLTNKGYRVLKYPHVGRCILFYPFLVIYNFCFLVIRKIWHKLTRKSNNYKNQSEKRTELNKKLGIQ